MASVVSPRSQSPVVENPCSPHFRTSLDVAWQENHPLWSSAKSKGQENPPPYTDGPSRVILANDGTKDCLALLLTPTLVAALNQITQDILALDRRDGALERIEAEITDLAGKADKVEEAIRNPRYQDRAEEMHLALEILQLKQEETRERKSKLQIELTPFESSLKLSRYQSQQVFEEALLKACLLDPSEPVSSSVCHDTDGHASSVGDGVDAASIYTGVEPTPEQQLLRDARMDGIAKYDALRGCQERFDDRQADHDQKLAALQRSGAEAECTRTQFDHQHIQHVRALTRDLMVAEQGYRIAKARVRALEIPADSFGYSADDGGRRSDEVSAEQSLNRGRIEAWARGVLLERDVEVLESKELDLDGWIARPVEIMDSISLIDREVYIDEINEWKEHCRQLREEASKGF